MNFGNTLRKFRVSRGLSQKRLSKLSNIPQTTISDLETEKYSPNLKHLKLLCKALEIPVSILLEDVV